jgi:hypothetical protein
VCGYIYLDVDVDHILIIYNEDHTNIDNTLTEFNKIHPSMKYTIEKKSNKLDCLDITIMNIHDKFTFNISEIPPQQISYTTTRAIHRDTTLSHQIPNLAG